MKCFVIAMAGEAAPVLSKMEIHSDQTVGDRRVVRGTLFGEQTAVVICGVGKVNAACGTQYAVDALCADTVINIGVAGGLHKEMKVAEIYAISAAVQYDFDLTQLNGTQIGTLDECAENYLKLQFPPEYPAAKLATGDRFNDSKADYTLLTETLRADIRDMEGGAIAQACMHAGIKCYSFKVVSDVAGSGSTTEQYKRNLAQCFEKLSRELETIWRAING